MTKDLLEITTDEINLNKVQTALIDTSCGAQLIFTGVVRNRNDGREVVAITYEAFEQLALEVFSHLASEVREKHTSIAKVAITHRIGTLKVGEISTVIGVSSAHRAECYEASRYIIEELKMRAPIWKEEHYANGENEWLEGTELSADRGSDTSRWAVNSDGQIEVEPKNTRRRNAA